MFIFWQVQAVYTVLREAEDRSIQPIPFWEIPIWKDISPKQKKVNASLKLINETLDDLIAICKVKFFMGVWGHHEFNLLFLFSVLYLQLREPCALGMPFFTLCNINMLPIEFLFHSVYSFQNS